MPFKALILGFALLVAAPCPAATQNPRDGRHDFDFEIGTWNIAVKRLLHPLTGSHTWVSPSGYVHIVRKVWGGRASLAELELAKPAPHFAGLMLRLYDPTLRRWSVYWASSADGTIDPPLVGSFQGGRGAFYGRDRFEGRSICVRVVYFDITPASFRTEQSFSANGGRTWEPNLVQTFTRQTRSL